MTPEDYRELQKEWDERSLDDRVRRWRRFEAASYDSCLPGSVWSYLDILGELFIKGHFLAAVVFATATVERCLSDQLGEEDYELSKLVKRAARKCLLTEDEKSDVQHLVRFRNAIVHPEAKSSRDFARQQLGVIDDPTSDRELSLDLFYSDFFQEEPSWRAAETARTLTLKFYSQTN